MTKSCQARQYSDQMQCARCGLAWDVNDPEPPECVTYEQLKRQQGREVLDRIKSELADEAIDWVAEGMQIELRTRIDSCENLAVIWAKRLPIGPGRDRALHIAEALHELGCRL